MLKIFFPSSGGVVDFKNSVNQCVNQTNLIPEGSKTKEICKKPSVSALVIYLSDTTSLRVIHQNIQEGEFPIELSFKSKPNVKDV